MEAPPPPRPRVERKGRFTITDISPVSPVAGPPPPFPSDAAPSADTNPPAAAAAAAPTMAASSSPAAAFAVAMQSPPVSLASVTDQKESDAPQPHAPALLDGSPAAEKTPTAAATAPLVLGGARVELEPEPSPVLLAHADAVRHAPVAAAAEHHEMASAPATVVVVVVPAPPTLQQQTSGGRDNVSPTSAAPVAPIAKPSLTIEVGAGSAVAAASPDAESVEAARSFASTPSQHEHTDTERRAAERRVIRKSRFTITDLDSPRDNSDGFFSQNYSASSSATYSAELPQTQPLPLTAPHVAAHDAASFQAFGQQHFRPQPLQQLGQVPYQTTEMGVQHRQASRTRSTPQKQRNRESRRARMRTVNPIHLKLEMSDLVHEPSGGGSGLQHPTSYTSSNGYTDDLGYPGMYFSHSSSSTDYSMPLGSSLQSHGGLFSKDTLLDRRQESVSIGTGRRSASSRQKSITVSATQFLQQQQTIAALIRQQQDLKRIVTVLQEQQQQLMSVPVQLHELQIENAKGDGKDERMVDTLMQANDSLKVLLTQTDKEAQDRAQEAEFLAEENDQLLAQCRYFERKYIEERKMTIYLEEEVQRFRMVSLTHELEQRNSTSQESP